MFWEKWIPKSYLLDTPICGVECTIDDNQTQYYYCLIDSSKKALSIVNKGSNTDLEQIIQLTQKKKTPILFSVTGKGIITKKIIFSENENLEVDELVKRYLSTINANEFYCQFYQCNENSGYLSVCRQSLLDELIKPLLEKQLIINVFIGPIITNALAPAIQSYNQLKTNVYDLELNNGLVDGIKAITSQENTQIKIDGLELPTDIVISFASCFGYLTQQTNYSSLQSKLSNLPTKHLEKNKLKVLILSLVAIFLVISATNAFLFFQKHEEQTLLETELNLYESKNNQITQLLENYQKKKNLIEQAGIFSNQYLSIHADKIAASLPEEILLRELNFNPMEQETEEDSLVQFNEKEIIIKGNCNKSLLLNEWLNVLKSQSFIQSADLETFIYHSEFHQPNFVIKLKTK